MALIYNASFDSGTRVLSLLDKAGNVISSCEVPSKNTELTLKATADNSSVTLTKKGTLSNEYEVNTGSGWGSYTFDTVINLNAGQRCKWRCSAHPTTQDYSNFVKFVMTGSIEASGNVNSMLASNFKNITSLSGYDSAFRRLFEDCTSLTQAPELPATALSQYCYGSMFNGCASLTQAPELPATALDHHCYVSMFYECISLTKAPKLPATTLHDHCYYAMFKGCIALTQAPVLPATSLDQYCYNNMFYECTALTQAPELPATALQKGCYGYMFDGCTSLTQAPDLPATTMQLYSCRGMFSGCTSLTKAPNLPATALQQQCYYNMFSGCTSLTKAPELPATTLQQQCYYNMFSGCTALTEVRIKATTTATSALGGWLTNVAATGTVYANPNFTLPTNSANGVPSGWTRKNIANYPTT